MRHDNLFKLIHIPSGPAVSRRTHRLLKSPAGASGAGVQLSSAAAAAAKSRQSCPTLCDPIDGSPRPWDSPGKNTGVGCHFPLQWIKVKSESEVAQSCPTLRDPMDCSSAALDNLLLCVTVEGPKTETLAVSSFPKVHDFCNPSPLRNGTLFKAGIWNISSHVFHKYLVRDQPMKWRHLL